MPGFKIKEQEGYNLSTAEKETVEAIAVLGDPGADRILFWDESANTWKFLTVGTGLNITATTLTSTGISNPMNAIGDMIYGDTAGAVARLAGNTTTTKKFLTSVGDGTNSTAPAYSLDFSTDGTLAGNSDTIIPSQKAIKTYVDGSVAGLLDYRGGYDASGNTYPVAGGSGTAGAVLKGDMWIISVAGTLGGEAVQVGDSIIANIDTPAQTASNWNHLNANISYVPENVANRLAAFQGTPDNNHYISEKLAYDQLALKANLISPSFTTPNIGSATGTSLALEGTTLGILNLKNTDASSYTRMLFDGTGTDFSVGVGNASAAIADLQNKFYIYDFTNSKTAFTIVPNTLAAKFYGSLEAINLSGTNTGDEVAASSAEINTGTDETKYVTPDALAGSNAFTKPVQQYCVEWGTELAVEDGVGYIEIPAELNGMNLISARARVGTPGVTGNTTFDIYNVTDSQSMLSSAITIASGATSGTGTVDTAHDDVATGDLIRIDCDTLSDTKPKGLIITLAFRLA